MIHYLTPYSIENNIGGAYNKSCQLITDPEDWIVIRDGDTMFLTPQWGRVIAETIGKYGTIYSLFGAKTNRVKEYHHLVEGMFNEKDLDAHYQTAVELEKTKRTEVIQTIFDVAGFFMAFQKKTFDKVGGFDENTPIFDRLFTRKVRNNVGAVGVMQGLYVLHAYRLWSDDAINETDHLQPTS